MKWQSVMIRIVLIGCLLGGCSLIRKSPSLVANSNKEVLLREGEAAPFDGVLITRGYFLTLKEYEDKFIQEKDL